jgi:branched-chain amino acid transport system substrate-binding protein
MIGVIGTFNSGCAEIIIPVLNQASNGGIAMLSPANTLVCLTTTASSCSSTQPDQYYPSGTRNYARVVAHDAFQGAAVSEFAQTQGVTSVYILNDKESYGLGIAQNFRDSAESLGIKVAGFEAWDPKASSYEALFQKIGQTDANAVFLGGLIDENGAQVIKDKVAVLGPNDGDVQLYGPDGFATQQTITEAGSAAAGMWLSVAGTPIDAYSGTAQEFVAGFEDEFLAEGTPIDPYAIFGAQAAVVMLDAIAASDGTRGDVITQLFATDISDGYLGSFTFDENGDPTGAEGTIVQFTIYKATDVLTTEEVITPQQSTVDAALNASG